MHKPTPQQEAIVKAARTPANLMLTAMAGCGKTSTLKLIAPLVAPGLPALALAFNKKIATELQAAFPPNFKVMTMNGLGHNAWTKALGKRVGVDADKQKKLVKQVFDEQPGGQKDMAADAWSTVMALVRAARSTGLVPKQFSHAHPIVEDSGDSWEALFDSIYLDYDQRLAELAYEVLVRSIKLAYHGEIDFDDQIYMSSLFSGVFTKFPVVMVDEAQDLSPLNHIQLEKVAGNRLIVCGDPRQAIYAFRGADSASMSKLRAMRQEWVDLPLSLTFRCSRAVVARQQHHAPGFTAAAANAEGAALDWTEASEEAPDGKTWQIADLEAINPGPLAILCRNNAPLFSAALRILRTGRGVNLMGSELAKGLTSLTRKLFPDLDTPTEDAILKIKEWIAAEVSKARANDKEERVAVVRDRGECLIAILENANIKTAGGIISTLNTMFQKSALRITLATGHKAKGLEWPTVCHLDPWRVPSKYAKRAAEAGYPVPLEQDLNLKYVIETRAQHTLVLANLDQLVIE